MQMCMECTHVYTHAHIYTHTYTHTNRYTHKHMHTYTHIYTCTHIPSHTYTHRCVHTCIHTCTHIHIHKQIHTKTRVHILTYIYTHTHTYPYTHTYTHRCVHTCRCAWTHTEHTPGLAGPRPGAEPLIPRPPSLAKHVLQEVTPREDTGALPRHAGTHLREVPAGAQALASALGLSSLPGPSTTDLVTLSPRNPSEPSHPMGAGSYPQGDGFAQCPHLALETCGSARATAAQPRASTPVHHPGPWCPQPCDLCTLCEKSPGLHSPCVHREPNIRCPEKECYLGEGQAPRQAGTVSLHLCRVAVGAEQPVITATGARHRGPRPRGQAQVPEVQTHPAAETGALWARAGAGPGQGRVA